MGLFSKPKYYDLSPLLSEEEIGFLILFFRNGWAEQARRRMGTQSLFSAKLDKEIIKSLQRKSLLKDEMEMVLAILENDLSCHPDDKDERIIIKKLRSCDLV